MSEYRHVHLDPETLRAHADEMRGHYAGMASWGIRENKFPKWIAGAPKDGRVLDIGCGSGALSERLLDLGYKNVLPVDINDYRSSPAAKALPFARWEANHERLPFPDRSIDVIFALQMLEHIENPWQAVREFARVLKVGGRCILSLPYGFTLPSRLRFLRSGNVIGYERGNNHITFLTAAVWDKLIAPYFTLSGIDWSKPFIKCAGRKLRLPDIPWLQRLFSYKVCYILTRHDKPLDIGHWKSYSSFVPGQEQT